MAVPESAAGGRFRRPQAALLLLALLLAAARLAAQESPAGAGRLLRTYLLPPRFYVGDLVEMRLDVEGPPPDGPLALPVDPAQDMPVPELSLEAVTVQPTGADRFLVSVRFRPFRAGKLRLPAIPVGDILLDGLEVEVLSALRGEEVLEEARGQLPLRGTAARLALLILGGVGLPLAAALAAGLGARGLRRARQRWRRERPWRKMRAVLRRLRAAAGRLEPRLFYFRLSAALREYLSERFAIPARSLTTAELDAWLAGEQHGGPLGENGGSSGGPPPAAEHCRPVIGLLEKADRVKFGGQGASAEEMTGVLDELGRTLEGLESEANRVEP